MDGSCRPGSWSGKQSGSVSISRSRPKFHIHMNFLERTFSNQHLSVHYINSKTFVLRQVVVSIHLIKIPTLDLINQHKTLQEYSTVTSDAVHSIVLPVLSMRLDLAASRGKRHIHSPNKARNSSEFCETKSTLIDWSNSQCLHCLMQKAVVRKISRRNSSTQQIVCLLHVLSQYNLRLVT